MKDVQNMLVLVVMFVTVVYVERTKQYAQILRSVHQIIVVRKITIAFLLKKLIAKIIRIAKSILTGFGVMNNMIRV